MPWLNEFFEAHLRYRKSVWEDSIPRRPWADWGALMLDSALREMALLRKHKEEAEKQLDEERAERLDRLLAADTCSS